MNTRTLLFICSDCKSQVFRAGKKVNQIDKLCGKCNNSPEKPLGNSQREKNSEKVVNPTITNKRALENKLTETAERLDKALEILIDLPDNTELTFYELWKSTR